MWLLDTIWADKRICTVILLTWLVVVLCGFQSIDLFHASFMRCGPSNETRILTVLINTWHRWWLVALSSFFSTIMSDFMSDSISPWIINTIQDQKTKYLPYSKMQCYLILQSWSIYCATFSIFSVALLTSQIDFLLIRLSADLIVNSYSSFRFMHNKTHNPRAYEIESRGASPSDTTVMEMTSPLDEEAHPLQRAAG